MQFNALLFYYSGTVAANLNKAVILLIFQLVAAESSVSDTQSQCTESQSGEVPPERVGGIGDSRPPSFQ